MNIFKQAVLSLSILATTVAFAEIPEKLQQRILLKAPQIDANRDGTVTRQELRQAFPGLPANYQRVLQRELPDLDFTEAAENGLTGNPNWLLMGHSFFKPGAEGIEAHAHRAGMVEHRSAIVISGAASGAPLSLWENQEKRRQIQRILDTGGIETLGMTFYPYVPGNRLAKPEIQEVIGYDHWVKYALNANPNLQRVFIAAPWAYLTDRGTGRVEPMDDRSQRVDAAIKRIHEHLDTLRASYPTVAFQCIPYGKGAYALEERFAAGELPGITHLQTPSRAELNASIYRDKTGHAAPILTELSQLIWLHSLYGVDLINDYPAYDCDFDLVRLKQIATEVVDEYQSAYGK